VKPGTRGDIQVPEVPLRPGRGAFSRRTRLLFTVGLAVALVVIAVAGGLLAGSKRQPPRSVTIPVADRNATPALIRAAEAVGFQPPSASGTGKIENEPAASAPSTGAGLLDVGAQAPDFTLRTPAGTPVRLAALRGKSVLLEFFATWCPHCAAEAPHLRRLARSLPRSRVVFVGVDANGGDAPSVFAYHVYYDLPFPAVLDPGGTTATFPSHGSPGTVSKAYRISTYPTFYVVDPQGRIAWRGAGEQPDALLRRELRSAGAGAASAGTSSAAPAGCKAAATGCDTG
jgi:peroxiredoxin